MRKTRTRTRRDLYNATKLWRITAIKDNDKKAYLSQSTDNGKTYSKKVRLDVNFIESIFN